MEKDSNEPGIIINFGDRRFEATPDNTSLFRFMGHLAMYNHVFIVTDEEEGQGTYLFAQNPAYPTFEQYMIENEYPIHDHLRDIANCDVEAFDKMIAQYGASLPDYLPDDFS